MTTLSATDAFQQLIDLGYITLRNEMTVSHFVGERQYVPSILQYNTETHVNDQGKLDHAQLEQRT
jgi:hypothetical protein